MSQVTAKMVLAACDAYRKSSRRKPVNGSYVEDMRNALEAALGASPAAPPCRLDPDDGQPAWLQINDLFNRHGLDGPPTKLRDELVVHLVWARYGEALSAAPARPTDRQTEPRESPETPIREQKSTSSSVAESGGSRPLRAAKSDSEGGH